METKTGLRLRPYAGGADLAEIVRVENAEAEADALPERIDVDGLAARYSHPSDSFQPPRDVILAELDGTVVGYQERGWVDTTDGLREFRLDGSVHPSARRQGVGSTLLREGEDAARRLAAEQGMAESAVLGSWSGESQPADRALLVASGYAPVRWFFDMVRPSLDDVPDVRLPEGLVVRPITPELAVQVWRADVEAFRDHWGGFDESEENLRRWLAKPSMNLAWWVVAFDGDEVAGGVINTIDAAENELLGIRQGWLASVFTRRRWRRRGVAAALIARSLRLLHDRGMTRAALGVDAENPSGALGLYERLGFEVTYRSAAWRKPL